MKLSLNWLKELVDIQGISPQELALKITMTTAELEQVERYDGGLGGILTCRLLSVKKHPQADKLTVVEVDTGEKREQVVCGAPNVAEGQVVPLAPPGSVIRGETKVRKARIRGVESYGMLCSAFEVGLGTDHTGILELDGNFPLGAPLSRVLGIEDWILEVDNKSITHRPDLWGHYGFAREISAILETPLRPYPAPPLHPEGGEGIPVRIDAPELCHRYMALVMEGFKVEESPMWMQTRLNSLEVRPINNLVDLTNTIMLEIGQPMHAFDLEKIVGPEIRVRRAREGEVLVTLDGVERTLESSALVIADRDRAVALAGIMGGENTEVDEGTAKILLESASFSPYNVRKTGARLGLRTEALARFEKSLDPVYAELGLRRFAGMLREIAPESRIAGGVSDAGNWKRPPTVISLRRDKLNRRLGKEISRRKVEDILQRLEFKVESCAGFLNVTVPTFRATKDVTIEEDLIEEVGRMYGYGNIEPKEPRVVCTPPPMDEERKLERRAKETFAFELGFREVSNYAFADEDVLQALHMEGEPCLSLKNPIAPNLKKLRRSLIPGILALVPKNQAIFPSMRLFEVGKIYLPKGSSGGELPDEKKQIAGLVFSKNKGELLFPLAKGAVEAALRRLRIAGVDFQPFREGIPLWLHPLRCCRIGIGKEEGGYLGEVHPQAIDALDIEGEVGIFNMDFASLLKGMQSIFSFKPLPKFPGIFQDISIVVDEGVSVRDAKEVILKTDSKLISRVELFDIFRGESIPPGKKSLSFRVAYQSPKKTLTDAEVARTHEKVVANLSKIGGRLRSL